MPKKLYNIAFNYMTLNTVYKLTGLSYILYAISILLPCFMYIFKDKNVSLMNGLCIILCAAIYLYFSTIAKTMRKKYDSVINYTVCYLLESKNISNVEDVIVKCVKYLYEKHSDVPEIHYNIITTKVINEYMRRLKQIFIKGDN